MEHNFTARPSSIVGENAFHRKQSQRKMDLNFVNGRKEEWRQSDYTSKQLKQYIVVLKLSIVRNNHNMDFTKWSYKLRTFMNSL